MDDPKPEAVRRFVEVNSTGDDEIDAIALCIKVISTCITDSVSRSRVASYLTERFPEIREVARTTDLRLLEARTMADRATLIERLDGNSSMWSPIMREAADEIKRLRAEVSGYKDYSIDLQRIIEDLCRLREIREPKTTARHHYAMAAEARDDILRELNRIKSNADAS